MRIADYHIMTARAGDRIYAMGRVRGQLAVWHDSKLYLYRQPPYPRGEVRMAIRAAWGDRGATVRLKGRWPEYTVETSS